MSNDEVVTSLDVAPKKQPKAFRDLNKEQLELAADAFGTDKGTKAEMIADLADAHVTWEMYAKAFKLEGHEEEEVVAIEKAEFPPTDIEDWPEDDGGEEVSEVQTVAPQPRLAATQKYLIKFIGENPYFEFGNYKFTKEKPYGIMPAADAQRALTSEPTKFRQAYPAELEEFYEV